MTPTKSWSTKLQTALAILFHSLIFIIPFLWTTTTSELFEFPKMLAVYAFTILIGTVWLIRMVVDRQVIFRRTFLDLPLLLFLTSQIISTLFSLDPHTSFYGYYSRFHGGLLSTLSYLILYYAAVSNLNRHHVQQILITLLFTGALASLYAFPEHFGHSPSCYRVTHSFDTACWVQNVQHRVFGTFGQPNWLAAYLITIFFLPLALILKYSSPWPIKSQKLFPLILNTSILILFFSVLLFTKSRSGLLGLGIGFIVFIVLSFVIAQSKKRLLLFFFAVSCLLLTIYLFFGRYIVPQFDRYVFVSSPEVSSPGVNPITTSPGVKAVPTPGVAVTGTQLEVGGTESGDIRRIVWTGALNLWKKYPLFGSGVETFAYGYYLVRPAEHNLVSEWDFLYNKAHNEFLNFLATTGLFGLLAYLSIIFVFIGWTIKQLVRSRRQLFLAAQRIPPYSRGASRAQPKIIAERHDQANAPSEPLILIAFISGYIALAISNFLGFSTVPVALLFFLFPAFAYLLVRTDRDQPLQKPSSTISYSQWFVLTLILIPSCFLLLRVNAMYQADRLYTTGKNLGNSDDLTSSLEYLQSAVKRQPKEPLYTDELSITVAKAALALANTGQATVAAQFAQQAETLSTYTLNLNPANVNFYRTRARVFAYLAGLDPRYGTLAQKTLVEVIRLAPTDAKLLYNLALLSEQLGQTSEALQIYQKTIELKPNYEAARQAYGQLLEALNQSDQALAQYQYILERLNPNNPIAASRSAKINL